MNEPLIIGDEFGTVEPNWKEILEAQKDNIFVINKTKEKNNCENCSRRKFYQEGYKEGFNAGYEYGCEVESDIVVEDYLKFKKIKNEVEKFISFYDGLPDTSRLNGQQLLNNLKEYLKRNE